MALDFPNSPTVGQMFPTTPTIGLPMWIWDGAEWTIPPLASKVVTVNATGTKLYQGTLVTSLNYTGLTIAAGTNTALVVVVDWDTAGTTPTGMTMVWDSGGTNQSVTRIVTSDVGSGGAVELWGLVNPTVGNKTLALSWTTTSRVFVAGMAFDGVDQTGGATSFPNSVHNASATSLTVTSTGGHIVIAGATSGGGPGGFGTISGTTIFSDSISGSFINSFANYDTGAGSVSIGSSAGVGHRSAMDIKAG
jgi:hypothetical protein